MTGEIVMASESGCPIEHHRIPVEKCDHMYDPECQGAKYMPFVRAAYDRSTGQSPNSPREQVNSLIIYKNTVSKTQKKYQLTVKLATEKTFKIVQKDFHQTLAVCNKTNRGNFLLYRINVLLLRI